jgi:hypothetical protein
MSRQLRLRIVGAEEDLRRLEAAIQQTEGVGVSSSRKLEDPTRQGLDLETAAVLVTIISGVANLAKLAVNLFSIIRNSPRPLVIQGASGKTVRIEFVEGITEQMIEKRLREVTNLENP